MFRISKATLAVQPLVTGNEGSEEDSVLLSKLCVSESWSGDLLSGIIRLGTRSSALHGLPNCECGLLSLMRCYDPLDHGNILRIFEQASTSASRFCFSTSINTDGDYIRPVFCMGESSNSEDGSSGTINGLFIFPRITN